MKRFPPAVLVVGLLAMSCFAAPPVGGRAGRTSSTTGKLPPAEVLRELPPADLQVGMRLRVQLQHGRPLTGTVSRITDDMIDLDLSTEETGLPGKVRLRKTDVSQVWELKPQTEEEKRQVLDAHRQKILAIRAEVQARLEEREADEQARVGDEKAAKETLEKALDIVVAKEEEERMRALVAEFPPEQWDEAKLRQIREDWILRDTPPSAKESRFVTLYEEWKRARDAVAVLDARSQEAQGENLLLRFPPSEGWSQDRLAAIVEKEARGEPVSETEAEFRKSYEAWSNALGRRAAQVRPQPAAEEKPTEQKPTEEKPAESKPTEEKPTEQKAAEEKPPAEQKPAEQKAAEEKLPAEAEKAPAETEKPPAETAKPD